jgi:hypothetical protein
MAVEHEVTCPLAIVSLTPHSMASISMTPHSMVHKPIREAVLAEEAIISEVMSMETFTEVTSLDTEPTRGLTSIKILSESIALEMVSPETKSLELESSKTEAAERESSTTELLEIESIGRSKTLPSDERMVVKVMIRESRTTNSSKPPLLKTLPTKSVAANPIVSKAMFTKHKSLPPNPEPSYYKPEPETMTLNLRSSKIEVTSTKATEIPITNTFFPPNKTRKGGTNRQGWNDQRGRNITQAYSRLHVNHRSRGNQQTFLPARTSINHSIPVNLRTSPNTRFSNRQTSIPSTNTTLMNLPISAVQSQTSKNLTFTMRPMPMNLGCTVQSIIPACGSSDGNTNFRTVESNFVIISLPKPRSSNQNLPSKKGRNTTSVSKTKNVNFMRKTINPEFNVRRVDPHVSKRDINLSYMVNRTDTNRMGKIPNYGGPRMNSNLIARGMNSNFMSRRIINPNVMASRALGSKAILARVVAASKSTASKLDDSKEIVLRKVVQKKLTPPSALRDDAALYPFKLIPSPAEGRPLETGNTEYLNINNLVEIWIATCPPKSIPAVLEYTLKLP